MKRVYHSWDKWECYKAGFYSPSPPDGLNSQQSEEAFAMYFDSLEQFELDLIYILNNWKYSCEQFLTNENLNRVAWLGQACVCHHLGISSVFRSGYKYLSLDKQKKADNLAQKYLNGFIDKCENELNNI